MASWRWDPAADAVLGSENMDDLYGLLPGEKIAHSSQGFALIHPDDVASRRAIVAAAVATGGGWHDEFRIVRPCDGQVAWLEEHAHALHDPRTGKLYIEGFAWDITARKQAEIALRASEEKYRTLFVTMDEGFALCELVRDLQGAVVDYRILEANPVFAAYIGFTPAGIAGRRRSEVHAKAAAESLAACARVVATGEPAHFEQYSATRDRWLDVRLLPHSGDQFAALFNDITERKRHEERQDFLLRLSDALRPLADPAEIQAVSARALGEHLGVTRVMYGEVAADGADLLVERNYVAPGAPVLTGRYCIADFGPALVDARPAGRTLAVPDVGAAEALAPSERAAYAALGIAALAGATLVRHDRFVASLSVHNAVPRAWSAGDLALIEETADRTWAAVERARTEAALRASEARLHAIANLVPDLLWSSDPAGRTDWYNQRWYDYTGQAHAQALGFGWLDAIHPQDCEMSILRFQTAADRGEPLRLEHRIRSAAGEYRWHLVQAQPFRDEKGSTVRWFGAATDIHEQRIALEALRTSEGLFRTLANAVPQVIWANNAAGQAIYFNQRWYDYTGLTYVASAGLGWRIAVHDEDAPTAVTRWQEAIATGETFEFEYRLRRRDGVYRWHLGRVVPLHDDHGDVTGWFGSSTDIHDLKQAEAALQRAYAELDLRVQERTAELRQLSQARQDLLQRLVTVQEDERRRIARELHDTLGQFLSALNLRLSILEQGEGIAPAVLEEIEQLRPAVQLIDRELDRLTMELRPPALDDFGLPAAVRNYAAAWARLAGVPVEVYVTGLEAPTPARTTVRTTGRPTAPRLAPEVETSVYRIVQEALTNVLKHAQASAVSVIVERRRTALRVIVEDNGIGFDPDARDGQAGVGPGRRRLGLLGMQERAALAGGAVQVESAPGAGTTIYVQIPFSA